MAAAAGELIPANPELVDRAFATAITTDTARYTELWDGLTTNQRRMLEALGRARPTEEVLSEEFRRRNRLGAYATVEREGRSRVMVPDVFLRYWLRTPTTN